MTTTTQNPNSLMQKPGIKRYDEGGEFIIHPLYDEPEQKMATDHLGLMKLRGTTRLALIALRIYLVLGMLLLLGYLISISTHAVSITH